MRGAMVRTFRCNEAIRGVKIFLNWSHKLLHKIVQRSLFSVKISLLLAQFSFTPILLKCHEHKMQVFFPILRAKNMGRCAFFPFPLFLQFSALGEKSFPHSSENFVRKNYLFYVECVIHSSWFILTYIFLPGFFSTIISWLL